jgi:type II secretory pathway pseudopilin PulG
MGSTARSQAGFTYLALLFAIAIIGITLASVGVVWSTEARREREAQLLFVGDQYRQAIGRYLESGGVYPRSLDDLLDDKRSPGTRRFLRRRYEDPVTGSADWELIKAPGGGILGVASTSKQKPIKVAGFAPLDSTFEKADCYCAWKFIYVGKPVGKPRELPQLPSLIQPGRRNN